MLSKSAIKLIHQLYTKKFRQKYNKFVVEGDKIVREIILEHPDRIQNIYAYPDFITKQADILSLSKCEIIEIGPSEMKKITHFSTPSNVLAIIDIHDQSPDTIFDKDQFTIILDEIQNPGNLGTIIRLADWFGIERIALSNNCADFYHPKVVQASMGSYKRVKFVRGDIEELLAKYPEVKKYGMVMDGKNLFEIPSPTKGFIIIGNEGRGIRPAIKKIMTDGVTIPRKGKAESLNAAIATGIGLAWFTR